jgi:hypothetical protein
MPSPFPGMDPFIEGQAWEDFHSGFVAELSAALVPHVRPKYVVRKERRVYVEHSFPDDDHLVRADVAVMSDPREFPESGAAASVGAAPSPVVLHLPMPEERREAFLTVRERETMEVVTVIELLSPANKRPGGDGRREYLSKRESILGSTTHLVELDLLRGGQRLPTVEPLPPGDYYAFVCRRRRYQAEVYPWTVRDRFPEIPIPLAGDDPDVTLDLEEVFTSTYDRAGYDYSLDYRRPIRPAIPDRDAAWVAGMLARRSGDDP